MSGQSPPQQGAAGPATADDGTVAERLQARQARLTPAERQLAAVLTADYPVAGLRSITALAREAGVSPPTVARFVQKLGFTGFAAFQEALRDELAARGRGPLEKLVAGAAPPSGSDLLARFAEAAARNLEQTLRHVDREVFEEAAALIADTGRAVLVAGGRFTGPVADYLARHLQVARPGVRALGGDPAMWTHALLDLRKGDVVVLYDVRRYQPALARLAASAAARGAEIVLFTDAWGSPISAEARCRFHARTEAPSAWDSVVALTLLGEALIARVQERLGRSALDRLDRLEELFAESRMFGRRG